MYSHSTRTELSLMTMIWTLTPPQNQTFSLKSRSFLHRVKDQVRKRQNQSSKDATKDSNKHSLICGMFMSSTLEAFVWERITQPEPQHTPGAWTATCCTQEEVGGETLMKLVDTIRKTFNLQVWASCTIQEVEHLVPPRGPRSVSGEQ